VIYRVTGASTVWVFSPGSDEPKEVPARLAGAFVAGLGGTAWSDLPIPTISHPRARFWFTEEGWQCYGRRVAAAAAASGRPYRVVRRKNPPESSVVYRDRWQVAVLPPRGHSDR
jgi:hypothetical protein